MTNIFRIWFNYTVDEFSFKSVLTTRTFKKLSLFMYLLNHGNFISRISAFHLVAAIHVIGYVQEETILGIDLHPLNVMLDPLRVGLLIYMFVIYKTINRAYGYKRIRKEFILMSA